jgi:hypothetical protein
VRRILVGTVLITILSCSENQSGRLEVGRDTVSLYGKTYSHVPIRIVRSTGDSAARALKLTPRDRSILRTSGNFVACLREGTTEVHVEGAEGLTTSFVANCRFATRIAAEQYFELEPGAEPIRLAAEASFASGSDKIVHAISGATSDSSVAVVRDGAVVPLNIGHVGLSVDYGGVVVRTTVYVRRTVFDGTVELAPGDSRRWPLDDGRYSITVKVGSRRDLNVLNMETDGLNCSRDLHDEDTIHCVARQSALVTLLNRGMPTPARTARARVRLLQVP